MALKITDKRMMTVRIIPLIAILIIIYFGVHLLQGDKGLLTYLSLDKSITELERTDQTQKAELKELEDKVMRLRPDSIDPDFATEQARTKASVMKEGEQVIIFDDAQN